MSYERTHQDFKKMYGIIFCNVNHEYIQLYRYYDIIKKLSCKNIMAYSMILHDQLCRSACNRMPTKYGSPSLKINNERGKIKNQKELEDFLSEEGYMKCNAEHLIGLNTSKVWYKSLKYLLNIGLLEMQVAKITPMIPIQGRFLPINYAYAAFLSRLKKDSLLRKSITASLSKIPEALKKELESFDKDELISEIIYLKTKDMETHKNSKIYKMLFDDVSRKYPHQWGDSKPQKERVDFIDEVLKRIPSNLLQNCNEIQKVTNKEEIFPEINPNKTAKSINKKSEKKQVEKRILEADDISRFEMGVLQKKEYKNDLRKNPETQEFFGIRPEDTIKEPPKEVETQEQEEQEQGELFFDDFESNMEVDLFGIPNESNFNEDFDAPELPNKIEKKQDLKDFWS